VSLPERRRVKMTSGFGRGVNDISAFLLFYAA